MADYRLKSEADTRELAHRLARTLPRGAILVLKGPLGAGKTTFVRYLAEALGFRGRVTSPTYTLMHVYPTPKGPLLHADLYRLDDPGMAEELGLFEEAEDARLVAVEWGEKLALPGAYVLTLTPLPDGTRLARLEEPE